MPLTDEFVHATFNQIDKNHDNKIQPEELLEFATKFIKVLIVQFETARELSEKQKRSQTDEKREAWTAKAKTLK